MRVLVDTSVWSLALRRNQTVESVVALELRHLISTNLVEIIGPIRQEILSGVRSTKQFETLRLHLAAFVDVPVLSDDHVTAAQFFNICRAKGVQGSNTDFLICAVAVKHNFLIFTTDADFAGFAKYLPIALYQWL